jgi:hypothetical protein
LLQLQELSRGAGAIHENHLNPEQKNGDTATTQDVLTHHLNSIGNIAGTMADYTAESRFFTPDGLLRGSEAIRRFFVRMFKEFIVRNGKIVTQTFGGKISPKR